MRSKKTECLKIESFVRKVIIQDMTEAKYLEIQALFESKQCKLLSTCDEYNEQQQRFRKVRFIAQCGHENTVFENNFKYKGTGLICKQCSYKNQSRTKKSVLDKNQYALQGYNGMIDVLESVAHKMSYKVTCEGCLADAAIKPKSLQTDKWLKLQFKTTRDATHNIYSFNLTNTYTDCIIVLYCIQAKKVWLLDGNMQHLKRINIGVTNSIYNEYLVEWDDLYAKFNYYYNTMPTTPFEQINIPISINSQIEQQYLRKRESVYALQYEYPKIPKPFDFIINGLRVQEKVASRQILKGRQKLTVSLHRSNGINGANRAYQPYEKGMNDFYWIHIPETPIFYIIPEAALIDEGYIRIPDVQNGKTSFYINLLNAQKWYNKYQFDYNKTNVTELQSVFMISVNDSTRTNQLT